MNQSDLELKTKTELIEIAKRYTVYYKTRSGKGSITNYQLLTKDELIDAILDDRDFQRDNKGQTRLERLKRETRNIRDPDEIMSIILDIYGASGSLPTPGNYYTYIYDAKTPNLFYDQHPLIACTALTETGFIGLNFHLSMIRNYTYPEVNSNVCLIEPSEISFFKTLNYKKLLYT
jgi:hypothetical protein